MNDRFKKFLNVNFIWSYRLFQATTERKVLNNFFFQSSLCSICEAFKPTDYQLGYGVIKIKSFTVFISVFIGLLISFVVYHCLWMWHICLWMYTCRVFTIAKHSLLCASQNVHILTNFFFFIFLVRIYLKRNCDISCTSMRCMRKISCKKLSLVCFYTHPYIHAYTHSQFPFSYTFLLIWTPLYSYMCFTYSNS